MPKTKTGICEPHDYYIRMKAYINGLNGQEFTVADLFSAVSVPYVVAQVFLSVAFRRGELIRNKHKGERRLCYHYQVSKAGLSRGTAAKGEVASLVWLAMQKAFPDFLPPAHVLHNITLMSGKDYHPSCVTRLLAGWFNKGYLEKFEGLTRKQNGYRIKPGVINRPTATFKKADITL